MGWTRLWSWANCRLQQKSSVSHLTVDLFPVQEMQKLYAQLTDLSFLELTWTEAYRS